MCVVLAGLGFPAGASAAITNVIATNELGEPLDEGITTLDVSENLWAYVTAQTPGIVCVHPVEVTESSSCDDPGVWGEAAVPPFFAGPVPVAPPMLQPASTGWWRSGRWGRSGRPICSPTARSSGSRRAPATAAAAGAGRPVEREDRLPAHLRLDDQTCQLTKALSLAKRAQDAKQTYDMWITAGSSPAGAFGYAALNIAIQRGERHLQVGDPEVPALPAERGRPGHLDDVQGLLRHLVPGQPDPVRVGAGGPVPGPLAGMTRWLQDPPQPFEMVTPPDFIDFARSRPTCPPSPARRSRCRARSTRCAATSTRGRRRGSAFRGPSSPGPDAERFAHAQARATAENFGGARRALARASRQVEAIRAAFAADGTIPESLTQTEIDLVGPYMERIRDSGFDQAEIDALHAEGVSDTGIAGLREQPAATPTC